MVNPKLIPSKSTNCAGRELDSCLVISRASNALVLGNFNFHKKELSEPANLANESYRDRYISNLTLTKVAMTNCSFTNSTFENVAFLGCWLKCCDFINCTFIECEFDNAYAYEGGLELNRTHMELASCDFTNSKFKDCYFTARDTPLPTVSAGSRDRSPTSIFRNIFVISGENPADCLHGV